MTDDCIYLVHILERLDRIIDFTRDGEEAFMADRMRQDAVIRNFEIIGEASKQISQQTKLLAPHVPWKMIAGFRDLLIHNYQGIVINRVWETVVHDLPGLESSIKALLMILEAQIERNDSQP